jgi:hypothetical protein
MMADHPRDRVVQPGHDAHHALSLPGNRDPQPVAGHEMNHHDNHDGTCGEPGAGMTGTPGSGGDPRKRAGRKISTALWVDLTLARGDCLLLRRDHTQGGSAAGPEGLPD